MSKVYWTPMFTGGDQNAGASILWEQPVPFLVAMRELYGDAVFSKCPAVIGYYKNAFVIKAPKDITVTMTRNPTTKQPVVHVPELTQAQFQTMGDVRKDGTVTLPPSYLFYSDDSVLMQSLPLTVFSPKSTKNMVWVCGEFDIGQWVRPVDCTFLLHDESQPVEIKRGDPLWVVRFVPKDDSKVFLERVATTPQITSAVTACVGVSSLVSRTPLNRLYKLADDYLRALGFKRKG